MGNWNEKQKFWAETIRTIVLGTIGAIFTYCIFNPIEQNKLRKQEIETRQMELTTDLVNEYMKNSYRYTSIVVDAFLDSTKNSEAQQQYNGEIYDAYRSSQNMLKLYTKVFYGDTTTEKLIDQSDKINRMLRDSFYTVTNTPKKFKHDHKNDIIKEKNRIIDWGCLRDSLKKINNEVGRTTLKIVADTLGD